MMSFLSVRSLARVFGHPLPMADVVTALNSLASLFGTYLVGVIALALVIEGYMYATALDDPQKLMNVKRAIGATIIGGIIVVAATTFAPDLVNALKK